MKLSSLKARLSRRVETDATFAIAGTLLFTAVLIFGHTRHEMWRDETHCWMVSQNATGFWDIIRGDRRYDGHPFLWYYVLHLTSRVVQSYKAMHVVTVVSATGAAYTWLRSSGFPRHLKGMILCSYYIAYEYTVLSRGYVLGLLFAFLFCALYHPLRVRYVLLASLLGLLAATSAYGTIIACSLAVFLFLQPVASIRYARRYPRLITIALPSEWLAGLAIFVFALAFTVSTTIPPDDEWFATGWNLSFNWESARVLLEQFWMGMVPVPAWDRVEFWNTNVFLTGVSAGVHTAVIAASASLFLAWLLLLRKRPLIMLTYLLGVAMMGFLQHAKYSGQTRHFGHCFLMLLVCLWLYVREERGAHMSRWMTALFIVNVGAQMIGALIALGHDYRYPFSGGVETAEFIRSHGLTDMPIVAAYDHPTSVVSAYLDGKKFFYPQTDEVADYVLWNNRRKTIGPHEMLDSAKTYAATTGKSPLLLTDFDMGATTAPGVTFELLLQTQRTIVADERFFLYRTTVK